LALASMAKVAEGLRPFTLSERKLIHFSKKGLVYKCILT